MAKFALNIGDDIQESFIFWLTRYLLYKTTTLGNSKADKESLQKALEMLQPTPLNLEDVLNAARAVNKAGISVYTLFYPSWLFAKDNCNSLLYKDMKDIDEENVMQWLSVATSSKSESTKKTYRTALQDFFNYLSRYNADNYHFDMDLSKWQRNLKNAIQKPPAFLTDKEVEKFLEGLYDFVIYNNSNNKKINVHKTAMYRFIFKLALASGLRVSEIVNLKMKDFEINPEEDIIVIKVLNSKGNKNRLVVIPYSLGKLSIKRELDDYMEVRQCGNECFDRLLCNEKKRCLTRYAPDKVIKLYMAQLGIKKEKMGMHLLRHTHASYFYSKTKDPVLLQERLGHSDPQTTRRYIHLEDEKVKKSVDAMR